MRVLVVDDESQLVAGIKRFLTGEGIEVFTAYCASDALAIVSEERLDVVVLDIRLPDMNGIDVLIKLKALEPTLEVIMLTGFASVDSAIRSMKLGAYDYLTKPYKIQELSKVVAKAYEKKMLKVENIVLEEQLHRISSCDNFLGKSRQMHQVKNLISIVAPANTPVLILGETGTGKELAARAIHISSPRSRHPFVAINSSALQETILESELFGYKKGAFTGAQTDKLGLLEIANKGTLFIDEIGDMTITIQAKLLRALETGVFMKLGDTRETRVDVRFVFATNKNLKKQIEEGSFRKDLFYRMNTFTIRLPSLREKTEDIPLLATYFLKKFAGARNKKRFSDEVLRLFMTYEWPGNVRELANVVERCVLISGSRQEIHARDFPEGMPTTIHEENRIQRARSLPLNLSQLIDEHIQAVLESVGGNKAKASRLLGISRKNLYGKMGYDIKK